MKRLFTFTMSVLLCFTFAYYFNAYESAATHSNNSCNSKVLEKGEGCFLYKVEADNFFIPVYYYLPNQPQQLQPNTKVVFTMHGEKRNAEDYRNDWRKIYNRHSSNAPKIILLAPQFEQTHFPKAPGYNLGNMFTASLNTLHPQNKWAFTQIENIFDFVKKTTNLKAPNYYLYGHSAGAQFVHRMLIFMPHTHIKKAVAAEAGSYTIPDENTDYPCGLKKETGDKLPSVDLKTTFSTPVTIILGTKDNKVLSQEHDTYKCDAEQGSNRLTRGEYFYTKEKSIADQRKNDLQWTIKKVTAAHIIPNTNPPIEDPMLVSCAALEFFPQLTRVSCR